MKWKNTETQTKDRHADKQARIALNVWQQYLQNVGWFVLFLHVFNPSTYHSHNPLIWNMDYAACYQWLFWTTKTKSISICFISSPHNPLKWSFTTTLNTRSPFAWCGVFYSIFSAVPSFFSFCGMLKSKKKKNKKKFTIQIRQTDREAEWETDCN